MLLPPGAGLGGARSVIYLGGVNLTGPLTVLAGYAAGGALVMLAAAAWCQHRTGQYRAEFERRAMPAVIVRAPERGEIAADTYPGLAFDLLFGPLAYRLLRGSPPDDETIGRLVDLAVRGHGP